MCASSCANGSAWRTSSTLQGGRPVDVAEAIGFLADPRTPINGEVLRVCGQLIVGR